MGNDDSFDAELRAVGGDVHPCGATEREEREAARVEAALDGRAMQQVVDQAVREPIHRARGGRNFEAERSRDPLCEDQAGALDVELGPPVEKEVRVEVAEDRIDVGDRRLRTAVPVADWTGIGASAAWAYARRPGSLVDRHDAPAGETERDDIELGKRVVVAKHHRLALIVESALADNTDLEGRSAHVGGDDVL